MEDVRDFLLEALEEGKVFGFDDYDRCVAEDELENYGMYLAYEEVLDFVERNI